MCKKSGGRRERHANIELSDSDIESESGELVHLGGKIGGAGNGTDDHVSFETDRIDGDTVLDETGDGLQGGGEFSAGVFEVVFVQVELGVGICGPRGTTK